MMEIRSVLGHRFVTDPDGNDRCLGCGWHGLGHIRECRPDTPRCGECKVNPADVSETVGGELLHYCGTCRAKMSVPKVYRCPWCSVPVYDSQKFTDLRGNRWHDGCLSDWAKQAVEIAGEG